MIKVGNKAPAFTLPNGNGDKVKTMAYELARNVIAELPQDRLETDE